MLIERIRRLKYRNYEKYLEILMDRLSFQDRLVLDLFINPINAETDPTDHLYRHVLEGSPFPAVRGRTLTKEQIQFAQNLFMVSIEKIRQAFDPTEVLPAARKKIIEHIKVQGLIESRMKEGTSNGENIEWFLDTRPDIAGLPVTDDELLSMLYQLNDEGVIARSLTAANNLTDEYFVRWHLHATSLATELQELKEHEYFRLLRKLEEAGQLIVRAHVAPIKGFQERMRLVYLGLLRIDGFEVGGSEEITGAKLTFAYQRFSDATANIRRALDPYGRPSRLSGNGRFNEADLQLILERLRICGPIESRLVETDNGDDEFFQNTRTNIAGLLVSGHELLGMLRYLYKREDIRCEEKVTPGDTNEYFVSWRYLTC